LERFLEERPGQIAKGFYESTPVVLAGEASRISYFDDGSFGQVKGKAEQGRAGERRKEKFIHVMRYE
jgi:hypothetical protein